jgi:hypothetical protein
MDSRIIREWNFKKNWVNANGNVHSVRNFGLNANANANGEDFLGHYSSLFLTTHGAFSDLLLGKIYIFDVTISKIIRNVQKKWLK